MAEGLFSYNALGLSITMRCPLRCDHCITRSGPEVDDEMTVEEGLKYLRDAAGFIDHVSFTGGEPLLKRRRLEILVQEAHDLGYIVSVMTSGYWGAKKAEARKILTRLRDRGLQFLGVSLDRFHLAYVSEDCCVHIAEVCDELEIPLAVRTIVDNGDDYGAHVAEILSHTRATVNVNWMVSLGRAQKLSTASFRVSDRPPRETCETVTAVDVVPGGEVYACCGPGLYMKRHNPLVLGNAQEENLGRILRRGLDNPFMKVINCRGPSALLDDLKAIGREDLVPVRRKYRDACQACLDVCNRPAAVEALAGHYAGEDIRRAQTALQFLKMYADKKQAAAARDG
jgi:hypothetical protein